MMLLGNYQILSGGMLCQQVLLRRGEKLLLMSDESKRFLLQTYADQHANLTPRQLQKLKNFRFRAFLWARLLDKQSSQHAGIRLHLGVLRHLMTKCIPMIWISPIKMPESPVKPAWQLLGSVVYDRSGYFYNGMYHDWSLYHQHITAITSHSKHPWIALMHSDGQVSIGKKDDLYNLFLVIHSPKNEDEKATAVAFHPSREFIAVAIRARIMVYKISPSLKPELHDTLSFYELGYFSPKKSANRLNWNLTGTFLTAISKDDLSMCYFIDPDKIQVIGGFNGGTPNYAVLRSFRDDISPNCSCFSVGGNQVMTGYPDGTLLVRSAVHTAEKGLNLTCLKILNNFLPGKIDNIVSHPHDSSVFAIELTAGWSQTSVLIVSVNHDGSVTIIATIPDAKSPHFHEDWLLVSRENRILFYKMDRCNTPYLVTEFQLPDNGMMIVRIGAFCVITTPDGKVMLYYSISGNSKLYKAALEFK
jgi:WD40 repeat protein